MMPESSVAVLVCWTSLNPWLKQLVLAKKIRGSMVTIFLTGSECLIAPNDASGLAPAAELNIFSNQRYQGWRQTAMLYAEPLMVLPGFQVIYILNGR